MAVKIAAVRGYGAQVTLVPIAERSSTTAALTQSTGMTFVHPSNDPGACSGLGCVACAPPLPPLPSPAIGAPYLTCPCAFSTLSVTTDVMSGQGTMALELLEQIADMTASARAAAGAGADAPPPVVDAVVVPVGGGGMASGVAMAVKVRASAWCLRVPSEMPRTPLRVGKGHWTVSTEVVHVPCVLAVVCVCTHRALTRASA